MGKIFYQNIEYSKSGIDCIRSYVDWYYKHESSMRIPHSIDSSEIKFLWNGQGVIGASIISNFTIPQGAKKLKYKFMTGTSYSTTNERFKIVFGLKDTYTISDIIAPTDTFVVKKIYNTQNTEVEDELIIPPNSGDLYIAICAHGWNMSITELFYE